MPDASQALRPAAGGEPSADRATQNYSDCGAVKASLKPPEPGKPTPALYDLILRIRKSFKTPPRGLRDAAVSVASDRKIASGVD